MVSCRKKGEVLLKVSHFTVIRPVIERPTFIASLYDNVTPSSVFSDNEKVVGGRRGARRRRLRVRHLPGRGSVERQEGRAEGVETQAAVRHRAHRPHDADQAGRLAAPIRLHMSHVQDGREKRHAVHHRTLDEFRHSPVHTRRQTARPLDHERGRAPLSAVPIRRSHFDVGITVTLLSPRPLIIVIQNNYMTSLNLPKY